MWTTKIAERTIERGALKVLLAFSNGTDDFTEYVSFQNPSALDSYIVNRLENLNAVSDAVVNLHLGDYSSKSQTVDTVSEDTTLSPITTLSRLKYLVDLGVKQTTDTDYQQALQAAKDSIK